MKSLAAIVCITIMVVAALATGHDGVILMSGLTIVAGLGGYAYGKEKSQSVQEQDREAEEEQDEQEEED